MVKKRGPKKKITAKQIKKTKALMPVKSKPKDEDIEGEVMEGTGYDNFGRPTVITEEVKRLMLEAFSLGCTNLEASLHAGIGIATLQRYFAKEENAEFKERCDELKETPVLLARMTLVKSLASSPFFALKYLERRKSDEFSIKIKQTFDEPEPLTPEEEEAFDNIFDENI